MCMLHFTAVEVYKWLFNLTYFIYCWRVQLVKQKIVSEG